jgi:hypothetical protein
MPLRRRLPDQWRITIPDEHDDFAMQAFLVKLESCLTLPIEAEVWIQSHLQRLARQWWLFLGTNFIGQSVGRSSPTVVTGVHNQKDGLLPKPAKYAHAFPDSLTFQNATTKIEQTLFMMFLEHRMRTFQGTFHSSPDYALVWLE